MKITRLYTGKDQKSYFEEIELKFGGDQKILTTDSRPATIAVFRCVPRVREVREYRRHRDQRHQS